MLDSLPGKDEKGPFVIEIRRTFTGTVSKPPLGKTSESLHDAVERVASVRGLFREHRYRLKLK